MTRASPLLLLLVLTGCPSIPSPPSPGVSSFRVETLGLFLGSGPSRAALPVQTACATRFGGQSSVPASEKGTLGCPYAIARGEIEIDLIATALDAQGLPAAGFNGSVSFRVVPGDLAPGYTGRFAIADGGVVQATVRTQHQYGGTRVWAEDAPAAPIYSDGGIVPGLPPEPAHRTYATGLSPLIYFEEPTLAKVQIPDGFDNRSSPLVGEFLTIGKNPESGEQLLQSCPNDPQRDGQPALMVITGTDPAGFYVTDVSACRQLELTDAGGLDAPRTAEPKDPCVVSFADAGPVVIEQWDGGGATTTPARCQISNEQCAKTADCRSYLPGTYGHMFIYNYSYPDGLDEGDLLWTLSGSVQEFTSTTQMTFPSWSIAEKVRRLPPSEWNKWLQYAAPVEINNRTCGAENVLAPFLTDQLCGHNRRNLKMESLESGLVKVRNVRFPTDFANCDANADFSVPFFCDTRPPGEDWLWGSCAFPPAPPEPTAETVERVCNSNCVIGTGEWAGKICSERTTYVGFGQFVVEMNPPGDGTLGFDDSVPQRVQRFDAGANPVSPVAYGPGVEVNLACNTEVRLVFNDGSAPATSSDRLLTPPNTVLNHVFAANENTVSVVVPGGGFALWGSGPTDVWAVGASGSILHSTGGGWTTVPGVPILGVLTDLHGLWGSGPNDVWAVGAAGTILRWNGTTWAATSSPSNATLRGLWGSGPNDVWAVGAAGTILRWNGTSWTQVNSGTIANLTAVWGSGVNDVWAVGEGSSILHYDGTGWATAFSITRTDGGPGPALTSVWGSGPYDLWSVGLESTLLHGTSVGFLVDGGSEPVTFSATSIARIDGGTDAGADAGGPPVLPLSGVWGSNVSNVWAVSGGDGGQSLRWNGTTWDRVSAGTNSPLFAIWGTGATDVWAVGGTQATVRYRGSQWSPLAPTHCWIAQNFHNRINLITKDALPQLQPDCRTDDPDPAKAAQCQHTRGASFDLIGHLRHLQPGRPRWAIIPRDPDDVCCHPGPGLQCPLPVKPCP